MSEPIFSDDLHAHAAVPPALPTHTPTPAAANLESPLYDADAVQHIPYNFEHQGRMFTVTFHMGPQEDETLIAYDQLMDTRLRSVSGADEGARGIIPESEGSAAAKWLFDKVASGVDGIGRPGTPIPRDWKTTEPITTVLKEGVVIRAYLAVEGVALKKAQPGDFIEWGQSSETSTVRLRALFNGHQVLLTHEFSPISKDDDTLYHSIKKRAMIVQGTKIGQSDTRIPATWKPLGALYDRLAPRTEGYKGRIPLHHKVAALDQLLGLTQEAVAKN
jgi:hypothetical protein